MSKSKDNDFFKYIVALDGNKILSIIASLIAIFGFMGISRKYFQVNCRRGDLCEEELIHEIGLKYNKEYIEGIIGEPYIQYPLKGDEIESICKMRWFYVQIIYDSNNASQCVFVTARGDNEFTHPYLDIHNEDNRRKINKNHIRDFGGDSYIYYTNHKDQFLYFEKYFTGNPHYFNLYFGDNLINISNRNLLGYRYVRNIIGDEGGFLLTGSVDGIKNRDLPFTPNTLGFGYECDGYFGANINNVGLEPGFYGH